MNLCVPFIIYAILAVLSLAEPENRSRSAFIGHAVMLAILYALCSYGYNMSAWLLLLWPFALFLILMLFGVVGIGMGMGMAAGGRRY